MKYKSVYVVFLFAFVLLLVGCDSSSPEANDNNVEVDTGDVEVKTSRDSVEVKVDTTKDGSNDVVVKTDGIKSDVTVDMEEVMTDDAKEAIKDVPKSEFCKLGETFTYESGDGNVDSVVLGLEKFKGNVFCKANSKTTISTPAGDIETDSIYYFDNTYKEYWVITTINTDMMPTSQVTETHIVDGEVV